MMQDAKRIHSQIQRNSWEDGWSTSQKPAVIKAILVGLTFVASFSFLIWYSMPHG